MNRKISTLMASVLLASAFSTAAYAAGGVNAQVKEGDYVYLKNANGAKVLVINDNNTLSLGDKDVRSIAEIHKQLWQVASVKYNVQTGIPVYQFINKATGQYLAIKLKTNNDGESTETKLDAAGNRDWLINKDNGTLSVFANDSTYTLKKGDDNVLTLVAKKGNAAAGEALALEVNRDATPMDLTAKMLNDLMANGKLYFNGKDVSEGNDNIISANPWKAYAEATGDDKNIFLMRADKDSVTPVNKNPRLLMVDTLAYTGGEYLKFVIDTLAISKGDADVLKDQDAKYDATAYAPLTFKAARQIETAIFNAKYSLYNDSISLAVKAPAKVQFPSTVTDFTNIYGYGAEATTNLGVEGTALTTQLERIAGYKKAYDTSEEAIKNLAKAVKAWMTEALTDATGTGFNAKFLLSTFDASGALATENALVPDKNESGSKGVLTLAEDWLNKDDNKSKPDYAAFSSFVNAAEKLQRLAPQPATDDYAYYHADGYGYAGSNEYEVSAVALKVLGNSRVLTVADDLAAAPGAHGGNGIPNDEKLAEAGYAAALIQPYATTGGDAVIDGNGKVYFIQVAAASETVPTLRAVLAKDKYLVVNPNVDAEDALEQVDAVDASNVYAQWAFIQGATGSYQVVNRGTGKILYTGPVSKGEKANTYVIGGRTYKLAGVDLSGAAIYDEKGTKYDYTGAFYAGPADGVSQSFAIAPASQFLTSLGLQFNKDSVLVLGEPTAAPQWYLDASTPETYGYPVPGLPELKKVTYKIYTKDGEGVKYYVYPTEDATAVFAITKEDSKNAKDRTAKFEFRTVAEDTYLFLVPAANVNNNKMATINLNMTQPVIEVSGYSSERKDYFTITKSEYSNYRTLTEEDGVLGNATIYMENEPNRFLYENTQNIVANNGNKIAKDSLNFLGIFNAAAMVKNAAIYVDTAYVDRKDNTRPQYMFAVGVTEVAATEGHACTEAGKHFDANGKETTADKCVHATPGTEGYKTGRYLVSLKDSVPTGFASKHPTLYDGNIRLAFVEAKHIKDTLEIANSKFTADEHVKDSIFVGSDLQKVTFALKIVDQATKSFVLETKDAYVRILNGVPVLTGDIKEAAVLNISATEAEATANEAIAAEGVQVIGGKGAVTVQGAAGKVITVANVLGQTIANQVAASDNVTIAAPAGIVVVAVEGEATKVVVK